jgi:hypothetical protein
MVRDQAAAGIGREYRIRLAGLVHLYKRTSCDAARMAPRSSPALIIVADDYGYSPGYDNGILEAARAARWTP